VAEPEVEEPIPLQHTHSQVSLTVSIKPIMWLVVRATCNCVSFVKQLFFAVKVPITFLLLTCTYIVAMMLLTNIVHIFNCRAYTRNMFATSVRISPSNEKIKSTVKNKAEAFELTARGNNPEISANGKIIPVRSSTIK
jgi:hypothetical protein